MQMFTVPLPSSAWSPDSFLLSGANLHTYLWEAAFVCLAGDRTGDLHMLGKFPCVELYFHTSYPHYSHKSFLLSYDLPDFLKKSLVQEEHIADNTVSESDVTHNLLYQYMRGSQVSISITAKYKTGQSL